MLHSRTIGPKSHIIHLKCVLCIYFISRLKKFEDDEDEESFSNMDTRCDVKPDSQLNRGSGSNSEYLLSMESGTQTESFSFLTF